MPRYVIEREFPGAGKLSSQELQDMARKSRDVLNQMGPQIQWLESYVADDKVYCFYIAADEKMILDHAERGGFPANRVSRVRAVIDLTTAEQGAGMGFSAMNDATSGRAMKYNGPERRRSNVPWTGVERRLAAVA